ncbi:hypothetical protein K438DRAFT_1751440 [Mycena galopus ATCC 62051]|nr:hypothetical protein K438DRAFT_1751440 [Mycena galopus ATCC 62051]
MHKAVVHGINVVKEVVPIISGTAIIRGTEDLNNQYVHHPSRLGWARRKQPSVATQAGSVEQTRPTFHALSFSHHNRCSRYPPSSPQCSLETKLQWISMLHKFCALKLDANSISQHQNCVPTVVETTTASSLPTPQERRVHTALTRLMPTARPVHVVPTVNPNPWFHAVSITFSCLPRIHYAAASREHPSHPREHPRARVDWPRPRVDNNLDILTAGMDDMAREIAAPFRHLEAATRRQSISEQQRAAWLAALTPLPASPTASQEVRDHDLAQRIALGYLPSPSPPPTSSCPCVLVASTRSPLRSTVSNRKHRRSPSPPVDPVNERCVRQKSSHLCYGDSDNDNIEIVSEHRVIKIEAPTPSRPAPVTSGSRIMLIASGSRIPPIASGTRTAPIIIPGSPHATPRRSQASARVECLRRLAAPRLSATAYPLPPSPASYPCAH